MRAIKICTPADDIVHVPHEKICQNNIANLNDGSRTLMCVASFYLRPDHDAGRVRVALCDVALSSAYLEYAKPFVVMLSASPLGMHYKLKACPFDMRDQFHFISDMTIRGKLAIADAGVTELQAMPGVVAPRALTHWHRSQALTCPGQHDPTAFWPPQRSICEIGSDDAHCIAFSVTNRNRCEQA